MSIIDRVKNIIISPKTEWQKIAAQEETMSVVIMSYVLPLALIGAAAAFIGYGFIGVDTGILGIHIKGMDWGLSFAIRIFVQSVLCIVVAAFVVDMLAGSFGSGKNLNKSAQLVAYAYTPSLVGAFLNIVPMLSMIGGLFGLYGIYLWYLGLGPLKKTPEDKKLIYLIISIIVLIIVFVIIGIIMDRILAGIFGFGDLGRFGRFSF